MIMKKLALLLCGLGSMFAISMSAATYASPQSEPQYQEQTQVCNTAAAPAYQVPCNVPENCNTVNNGETTAVPCNTVPCVTDTVCNPAPCVPAPCTNAAQPTQSAPANTAQQTVVVPGCC